MLKLKKLGRISLSAAITAALICGMLPAAVGADSTVTILNEGFEADKLEDIGWSCEPCEDREGWVWLIGDTEELFDSSIFDEDDYGNKEVYDGEKSAYIDYAKGDYYSYLITPEMDLSSYNTATINFYYINRLYSGKYRERLSLWYRVSDGDWMPITIFEEGDAAHDEWTNSGNIAIPDDALKAHVQLGFKCYADYGWGIALDNVVIKGVQISPKLTGGIAHVQDIGNKPATVDSNGVLTLGTTGQSKRLESILIDFVNESRFSGNLEYRVHVQDIGWMDWTGAGNPAGTSGQAKRLEAIEIRLTGDLAKYYSVEYCAHIQDYGDAQGWVRDGALAGTTGESKRIEQIKVRIVKRDSGASTSVNYRVHVQDYGWESKWVANGVMSGTSGQSKRLEGIEIHLAGCQYSGGIRYKTHIQNIGWESTWTQDGEMSGTQGQSLRLEAIQIELYGEMASHYDVYYRVHAQDIGWMSWARNGASAGTAGRSARLEGIQIVLVPKGGAAPAATYQGIKADVTQSFIEGF